jgi:hypothetical protein
MAAQIIPVIMCGGAGTRLWPVSRESMPKQFVPLIGAESTFQQVLARIADPDLFARPIVITKADFRFVVAEQLRERGMTADIVLEPMPRDSGPAVAVAAVLAADRDRDALVLVLAADHVIRKPDASAKPAGTPLQPRPRAGSSPSASSRPTQSPATAISVPVQSSTAGQSTQWRHSSRSPTQPRPRNT